MSLFKSNSAPLVSDALIRCVGTYHKSGTVWMRSVFKKIAKELGLDFIDIKSTELDKATAKPGAIYFQTDSRFPAAFDRDDVRGFRIVRDPRDVVISGAHYHVKSSEPWLHVPKAQFGGLTYQEKINSFEDQFDRYRFEMSHCGKGTIRSMVLSRGNEAMQDLIDRRFLTIRYETLIEDVETAEFRRICDHLELPFDICAPIFVENSLFSDKGVESAHIRSGKKEQWAGIFTRQLARQFAKKHQAALEALGYESDDGWIERCPRTF